MNVPERMRGLIWRLFLVVLLLAGSVLTLPGLLGTLRAEEGSDKKDYVRPVDSTPPLSETEKEPGWSYNSDYLFVISRSVRDSNVPPAGKVFLFIPAIPLDIVLFPVAAVAGLFGD